MPGDNRELIVRGSNIDNLICLRSRSESGCPSWQSKPIDEMRSISSNLRCPVEDFQKFPDIYSERNMSMSIRTEASN